MKYLDLVSYVKENRIDWNVDLFDVLRGFFEQYSPQSHSSEPPIQQEIIFPSKDFEEPKDGEYTTEDLLSLLQ